MIILDPTLRAPRTIRVGQPHPFYVVFTGSGTYRIETRYASCDSSEWTSYNMVSDACSSLGVVKVSIPFSTQGFHEVRVIRVETDGDVEISKTTIFVDP